MKNSRFKNIFTGDCVTVTDRFRTGGGSEQIIYEKDIPSKVGSHIRTEFSKPAHVFNKAYVSI
jgi:hypothetical protein